MRNEIHKFIDSESGAVTVDWVILTSAIVGIAIAVPTLILPNLLPVASGVQPALDTAPGLGASLILGQ
ncbi:MAG: hypothetical protein COA53_03870 [Rhodobacteraceae bacterium]|nr:MAG: hypothetical protein COA53_03870 [Paracoccaceae bacterium]